jgi:hypothetical protein
VPHHSISEIGVARSGHFTPFARSDKNEPLSPRRRHNVIGQDLDIFEPRPKAFAKLTRTSTACRLAEWKVEGGLPAVTFVVIAHTDKKGQALFGSIAQFADCDVLYELERVERANQATLECVGARDIEDPPAITFEMEKMEIVTAKGKEFNLVVSKEVEAAQQDTQTKTGKEQKPVLADSHRNDLEDGRNTESM